MDIKGIGELYKAGDLQGALIHSKTLVRDNPDSDEGRGLLMQLYLFAGELEKAQKQLEFLEFQKKDDLPSYMTLKVIGEMINCEIERQAFYNKPADTVPTLFEEDEPLLKDAYLLFQAARSGELAADDAARITAQRPTLTMQCHTQGEEEVGQLIEPDDLTAFGLEVFTARKGYSWLAWENIESVELHPYEKPMDLIYRRAVIRRITDTPETPPLQTYIPAIYALTSQEDVAACMGRTTDWKDDEAVGIVTGEGQKCLLIGERLIPLLQIDRLTRVNLS
ncbi:type VI secretion system accessory protein TagJ [Neptunomonas sp.]|uniref:type VI secretion system accessory protein TagJ n=1 Tax=Neptunomonas sp. TaxID=1971898 RepID=UPI0025CEF4CE|nr:type VI secretion system accessory protein TagJ [Neptunomonas sp.]